MESELMPLTPEQLAAARAFEYLLNAMENASQADHPAELGYGEKRKAVLAFVSAQTEEIERLKTQVAQLAEVEAENEQLKIALQDSCDAGLHLDTVQDAEIAKLEARLAEVEAERDRLKARISVAEQDQGKQWNRADLAEKKLAESQAREARLRAALETCARGWKPPFEGLADEAKKALSTPASEALDAIRAT